MGMEGFSQQSACSCCGHGVPLCSDGRTAHSLSSSIPWDRGILSANDSSLGNADGTFESPVRYALEHTMQPAETSGCDEQRPGLIECEYYVWDSAERQYRRTDSRTGEALLQDPHYVQYHFHLVENMDGPCSPPQDEGTDLAALADRKVPRTADSVKENTRANYAEGTLHWLQGVTVSECTCRVGLLHQITRSRCSLAATMHRQPQLSQATA